MPIYTSTTLDDPLATRVGTIAQGINATGQIVGYYTASVNFHGFLLSGGTYTTLDDPLTTSFTEAFGINASGQIVGHYRDAIGRRHVLLFRVRSTTTHNAPVAPNDPYAHPNNA